MWGKNEPGLAVDGIVGPKTRAACEQNISALARTAIFYREDYYYELARSKPSFRKFLTGWLNRTRDLREYIKPYLPG